MLLLISMRRFLTIDLAYLSALFLVFLVFHASATTYYVDINNVNPTPPYTNWSTASTDIQSAVNLTTNGDLVLVNPGVYQSGGYAAPDGSLTAVVVSNSVTLQSVDGESETFIDGSNTMRCVCLTDGVSLIGFTLTNGYVPYPGGAGGGAYCTSTNAMLVNCTLVNNYAGNNGGGAVSGSLFNCTIWGNSVAYFFGSGGGLSGSFASNCDIEQNRGGGWGGGAEASQLYHCTLANNSVQSENGGGADGSTLEGCIVTANHASATGGGANSCVLDNCVVSFNGCANGAGGVSYCMLTNCTMAEDSSYGGTGGADNSTFNNCILYDNSSTYGGGNFNNCVINYSCTTPLPTNGVGNITNAPQFVNEIGGDFHLQSGSPCINAGNNSDVASTVDLDENPRIIEGTVDMGAYEFQSLAPFVQIQSDYTNTTPGVALNFSSTIVHGVASETSWDFGDGTVVSNQPTVSHSWVAAGNFPVVFSASGPYGTGSATQLVHVEPAQILPAQTNLFSGAKTNITLNPGFYEITAYGAQGSYGDGGGSGGPGAEMSAEFYISGQTNLTLLVGGGGLSDVGHPGPGGGGGGSFVVEGSLPLVIAGGGGGGGNFVGNTSGNGYPGLSTTTGGAGDSGYGGGGAAGYAGSGGGGGGEGAGGGGGYEGAGANGGGFGPTGGGAGPYTNGGASFIGGGTGGIGVGPGDGTGGGNGGYGGGGGGGYAGGGGGGGYSGGGAASYNGGGGGGSYIDGSAIAILNETSGAGDGSVNGEIIITAVSPPYYIVIVTQPSSQAVVGGQTATFSVSAVNSPPFSYQWLFNGTNIAGATNATYQIFNVQSNNAGAYSVFISDATTSITSSNALLTVIYPPPVIVSSPTNETVIAGSNAVFSVSATNYYPMSFQWQFNGTNLVDGGQISGSTNSTLTVSPVMDANAGSFQVIAYNDYGAVTSSIALLTVVDPIQIIAHPTNQILLTGSSATFTVTTAGTTPGYQWYFNGVPLADGGNVSGSTSPTLTLINIQNNNSGNYAVIVTNAFSSSATSNATLTVINPAPVIVSPPVNLAVALGSNAVFSIYATNYFPLSYQWQFNGTNLAEGGQISGSVSSNLMISSVQATNAGPYQVIVSDGYVVVTSSIVSLTVDFPVQITGQPASETLLSGNNTSFTVVATGSLLNYHWYCNGLPLTNGGNISGSTTPTLNISNIQTNNNGVYSVWVTNFFSGVASSNAMLAVYNPAQIITQPANAGILLGSNVNFTASATGTAIGYQWYFKGTPLTDNGHVIGSATPTLSITNVGSSDGGDYQVLVTNLLSSAISRRATLTPLTSLAPSIRYVNVSNSTPASPYLSWSNAATDIQTAINASIDGDQIITTDGVYQSSGYAAPDGGLSTVVITNMVTLQSVNGPAATFICGSNSMRCVYLLNGSGLAGFTLTNGLYSGVGGGVYCVSTNVVVTNCVLIKNTGSRGAGVYLGTLNNCTLVGNICSTFGGGAYGSFLNNCMLTGNSASNSFTGQSLLGGGGANCTFNNCYLNSNSANEGGGAYASTLNGCTVSNNVAIGFSGNFGGGGVYGCTVQNTLIVSNTAQWLGGGAYNTTLSNCVVQGNHAQQGGGVVVFAPINTGLSHCAIIGNWASVVGGVGGSGAQPVLTNCVISGNRAGNYAGVYIARLFNCSVINNSATNTGGGIYNCIANNSVVYYNTASTSPNVGGTISATYCCFGQDVSSGSGFFTNAPQFINLSAGDFHLQSNSPCINSGNNNYVNTAADLDGNPRIVGGTVDIGAYEYQTPLSMVSYEWLEQYGLPITTNTDTSSPNGTAFNVYQDWVAGLNPTNSASVLAIMPLVSTNNTSGITVTWQSVSGIHYSLQRSQNHLSIQPIFSIIRTNILGQANSTSYQDTSATNNLPYFYRVGVP